MNIYFNKYLKKNKKNNNIDTPLNKQCSKQRYIHNTVNN